MNIRSISLTTDLALIATRGRVIDRGTYLVAETPDDPGYFHGNFLVLPRAVQPGEVAHWLHTFAEELGQKPEIRHVTLYWDGISGDEGAADELRAAGFMIDTHQAMVAEEVDAPPAVLPIRVLAPDELIATADLGWAMGDRHDETYRQFLYRRAAWQRDLVVRGSATFYGAFDGAMLVASLGVVRIDSVGRYQDVQTLPAYRRRGLARALLATAARSAFVAGAERVVIVTDPESAAARLYARAGFRVIERVSSACRYPPDITRPIRVPA